MRENKNKTNNNATKSLDLGGDRMSSYYYKYFKSNFN